jgi:hypothetical protein
MQADVPRFRCLAPQVPHLEPESAEIRPESAGSSKIEDLRGFSQDAPAPGDAGQVPRFLASKEFARLAGVSTRAVTAALKDKRAAGLKTGKGRPMAAESALQAWPEAKAARERAREIERSAARPAERIKAREDAAAPPKAREAEGAAPERAAGARTPHGDAGAARLWHVRQYERLAEAAGPRPTCRSSIRRSSSPRRRWTPRC